MIKDKKGFTLIELLVVIALTISILGITIVSFINVSERKKTESWQQVKGQVETAAKEYFTANEYLFEGLSEGAYGTISVGKLVEEDYLNKIVNPETGKAISKCAVVKITKNGNKYTSEFVEDYETDINGNCDSKNNVVVSEPGAPSIDPKIMGTKGQNSWYISNVEIDLDIKTNNNGAIKEVDVRSSICSKNANDNNKLNCTNNGTGEVFVTVTNNSNRSVSWQQDIKIDSKTPNAPTLNVTKGNSGTNGWYTSFVTINAASTCQNVSGCTLFDGNTQKSSYANNASISYNFNEIGNTAGITKSSKICSNAGLCSGVASKGVKVDSTVPTAYLTMKQKPSSAALEPTFPGISNLPNYSNGTWLSGYVYLQTGHNTAGPSGMSISCSDSRYPNNPFLTWRNVADEGTTTIGCTATTGAGLTNSITRYVNLDRTAPTFNVVMKKKNNGTDISDGSGLSNYDGSSWYNGYVFTGVAQRNDNLSGVKSTVYTTTGATTNTSNASGAYRNINAEGKSTIAYTVCDNANNCSSISKNIYLERTVTLRLDLDKMKYTKGTNGKYIFAGKNEGCSSTGKNCYYSPNAYRGCNKYSSSNTAGCYIGDPRNSSTRDRGYIAISCKNVNDFARYFYVSSVRFNNVKIEMPLGKTVNGYSGGDLKEDLNQVSYRKDCSFSGGYNKNCGSAANGAVPNFTIHHYYFQSNSGAKSNEVVLYTRYSDNCGY